uniref:Protein translocase subunit secE n=1 Tax=Glaucocystis incrassata TaxID=1789788 RepID=A0A3G1IVG8_9EUKA|nr:protein translocase subunit secE [Glaucocystis incrassata]ASQ40032.1 protein translocase subunit secE [Glaucocystis incrassata]
MFLLNFFDLLKGIKKEFEQISWPTQSELLSQTKKVIVALMIFIIMISLTDGFFQWLAQQIFIKRFQP